jgi:hypothetical protein
MFPYYTKKNIQSVKVIEMQNVLFKDNMPKTTKIVPLLLDVKFPEHLQGNLKQRT